MKIIIVGISLFFMTTSSISQRVENGKVDRGDFSLHYKIYGTKGEYVLLLSGGPGSDVGHMKIFADTLHKDFQCILLEQRGTGRSVLKKYDSSTINMNLYVEDIEALRKQLKAERFIVLGASWGALLSLLYSSAYPAHVSKIIIAGAGPLTSDYANVFDDNLRMRFQSNERELRNFWRDKMREDTSLFVKANYERTKLGWPAYFYDRNLGLKEAANYKITDDNFYVFPAFFKAHSQFDVRPRLSKITAPLLIIQGRQDPGGEANVMEINQLIKSSKLKFIERCGHMPELEKPAETWKLINEFLSFHSSNNEK